MVKKQVLQGEISGSNGGDYDDGCLLGCCAVLSGLIMEAASTSETSVNVYHNTRRNNPEYSHFQVLQIEYLLFLSAVSEAQVLHTYVNSLPRLP
jgi:hypothetical protein